MQTLDAASVRLLASADTWMDGEVIRQLYAAANLEGVREVIGFPDVHPGGAYPVGVAIVSEGVFYPQLIGGDIGCGIGLWKTDLRRRKSRVDRWAELRLDLEHPWEGEVQQRLAEAGLEPNLFSSALGTIGGGNHFAEIQAVEKVYDSAAFEQLDLNRDELLILVHSGSRGLGESVLAEYIGSNGGEPADAGSEAGREYIEGHEMAVRWAKANRALIAERFAAGIGASASCALDVAHNSITASESLGDLLWIHRKGAAAADEGPLVIAGSRGTLSYLVAPTEKTTECGWSVAHGAGRKWTRSASRARVRERFRPEQLVQTELGGRVVCEDRNLLYEEAPMAYKNIERVIRDLLEARLIRVIASLRPLLTYKTRVTRR